MKKSPKKKPVKKKKRKGGVWIVLGLLFLLAAGGLTAYNYYESYTSGLASEEVLAKMQEKITETHDADPDDDLLEDREMPTIEIDGYRYIGYLNVPDLKMTLPVMEEWDYKRLKIAPCRYAGSYYQDNLVIAGHNYRRHFSPLRGLENGTKVNFIDVEGNTYHYEIAGVEILKPDQVDKLVRESEKWDLTLFTCTIGGQTRHTIRCVRIDDDTTKDC